MMLKRALRVGVVGVWVAVASLAGAGTTNTVAMPPFTLTVATSRPEAIYRAGEKALFLISLVNSNGVPVTNAVVRVGVDKELEHTAQTLTMGARPAEIAVGLDRPGFVQCSATYEYATGKTVSARCGAGFEPLEIRPSQPEPVDFDEFWAAQKAELSRIPMNPVLAPVEPLPEFQGKVEAFNVTLACPGGAPVSGYLSRPIGAAPASLPAFLYFHGAGVNGAIRQDKHAVMGMLAMDINAHGIENGKPAEYYKELRDGRLKGYPYFGVESRDRVYFRGMFLRVLRALEYIKSRPEWDGRRLVVMGSSQGGAQALVAAGLDSQVSYCAALVPAMCDHTGVLVGRPSGWPQWIKRVRGQPADPAVVAMAPYYDVAHFAARIKAETFFNVGFVDSTTPPGSVYAAYNSITSPKHITNWPLMGHEYNDDEAEQRVAAYVKKAFPAKP